MTRMAGFNKQNIKRLITKFYLFKKIYLKDVNIT